MRKPKAVQIMGQWFEIEYHDDDFEHDGMIVTGLLDFDGRKIEVVANRAWKLSLWHECVHAALRMSGLDEILGAKNEEAVVRAIEHALGPIVNFEFKTKRFKF